MIIVRSLCSRKSVVKHVKMFSSTWNEKPAFSHAFVKFRFRDDGLVWTVNLTVEMKLLFQTRRRSVEAAVDTGVRVE